MFSKFHCANVEWWHRRWRARIQQGTLSPVATHDLIGSLVPLLPARRLKKATRKPTAHETAKYTAVTQKRNTIRNCKPPGSSAGNTFVGRAKKSLIFSQSTCDGLGSDDTNPLQTLQSSITHKTANVLAKQMATRTRAGIVVLICLPIVIVMATPLARASVDRGVYVVVTGKHGEQKG